MGSIKFSSRWVIRPAFPIFMITLALLVTGIVFAAPLVALIDTNDGQVDSDWGTPIYTSAANQEDKTDTIEIKNAWLMSDSEQLYFRIQTYAASALISGYGAVAAIDCNQDGLTNTRDDRLIAWEVSNDALTFRYGDTLESVGQPCIIGFPCEYGERVNVPNNDNVEWRADYSVIDPVQYTTFPADCRDAVNISLAIVNMTSTAIADNTPLYPWNVPTSVDVKEIKAASRPGISMFALGGIALVLVGGLSAGLIYRRQRKNIDKMD